MSTLKVRPFEIDTEEYPFEPQWFEREGNLMHYVDEGEGMPVVMLHGNPTWSFLYRKVIKQLSGHCRCLAPDYPGFGCSDTPQDYNYSPEEHAEWIEHFLDEVLKGEPCILVGQDWGGPIGLSAALKVPERVAGLVLGNTWAWPLEFKPLLFSWAMGSYFPGKYLQIKKNFFARTIVPSGIHKAENRTKHILEHYLKPFPDEASRMGTWVFPRALRTSSQWLEKLEKNLKKLPDVPAELVWGMRDKAFGENAYLKKWLEYLPQAGVTKLEDASHYLQEDRPDAVADAVKKVIQKTELLS